MALEREPRQKEREFGGIDRASPERESRGTIGREAPQRETPKREAPERSRSTRAETGPMAVQPQPSAPAAAAAPKKSKEETDRERLEAQRQQGIADTNQLLAAYQAQAAKYQQTFDPLIAKVQQQMAGPGPEQAMLKAQADNIARQQLGISQARGYNPLAMRAALQTGATAQQQASQQAAIMGAQRQQALQQQELGLMQQRAQAGYTAPQVLAAQLGESQYGRSLAAGQQQQQQQLAYQYAALKAQQEAAAAAAQRQQSAAMLSGLSTAGAGLMMAGNPILGGTVIGAGLLGYGSGIF